MYKSKHIIKINIFHRCLRICLFLFNIFLSAFHIWEFLLVYIQIDPFLVDSSGLLSPIQWVIYINVFKNFIVVLLLLTNNKDIAEAPV